jgi:penicillin amidase
VVRGSLSTFIQALIILTAVSVALIPLPFGRAYYSLMDPAHGIVAAARYRDLQVGRVIVPDVPGSATIIWDKYGIPHIYATTDEAGFYALGWVEASLRLFQMDLFRRLPEGRLSALLGPQALPSDEIVVKLGLPDAIEKYASFYQSDPALREMNRLIHYFILGINDYIDAAIERDILPLEYKVLGLKPEKWTYTDIYAVSKLPAILYSFSESDLLVERLVRKWGPDVLVDLGIAGDWGPYTASCNESRRWSPGPTPLAPPQAGGREAPQSNTRIPGTVELLEAFEGFRELVERLTGIGPASTAFVVNPAFTSSHVPLLVDDLHESLTVPPPWLIVHLVTHSFQVAGLILPGTPFVLAGRNLYIAWGFTSSMADQIDFYYFKWSKNGKYYYYNNEWKRLETRNVTLKVWDPARRRFKFVVVTVENSAVGPIVSYGEDVYAVKWTALYKSNELAFLWRLNRARNYRDALRAQLTLGTPLLNLFVADREGHIAWSPVGLLPLRGNLPRINTSRGTVTNYGFMPFNASAGEGVWEGFIPRESLRVVVDPRRPFIANANNRLFKGLCNYSAGIIYYGYEFDSGFRYERLESLLYKATGKPTGMSVVDAEKILADKVDLGVERLAKTLAQLALRIPQRIGSQESEAINLILSWNGTLSTGRGTAAPAIAYLWATLFASEIWHHLTGLNLSMGLDAPRLRYIATLVNAYSRGEQWTYKYLPRGYAEEVALKTLEEVLSMLEGMEGTRNMSAWDYGKVHYFNPMHPLGWLIKGLNLPDSPAPGGANSLLVAKSSEVTNASGAPVGVASVGRVICDLSSPLILVIIPGGESGNPFTKHYSDLYKLWLRGEYVELNLTVTPAEIAGEEKLYINAWG